MIEISVHNIEIDERENCYCRAANDIIPFDIDRCLNCPLHDDSVEEIVCVYENSEISQEFPNFVPNNAWPDKAKVYEMALQFAAAAHKGKMRKGTMIPYIVHPVEASMIVYKVLLEMHNGELTDSDYEVIAAAALHDVIEDTEYTAEDIEKRFGRDIASLVLAESENKRENLPAADSWKIRKVEFLEHLNNAPNEAKMIALGDKLSNIRATAKDYRREGDGLFERFNQKDKKEQEWYYRSIAEALKCFENYKAYREYVALCNEVFK